MNAYRLTVETNEPCADALARHAERALNHSPDVLGNARTSGIPTNWATALPDPDALPVSEVRRGRNKKGTTARVVGTWPLHKVTVGDPHYVDPVLDMVAAPIDCSELGLIRAADAILSRAAGEGGDWPRLLGSRRAHLEQLPERIPSDRATIGATSIDVDDWHDVVPNRVTGAPARRFLAQTTVKRVRGKRVATTDYVELAPDDPAPRPVTILLTAERNGSGSYQSADTSIRDRYVPRTMVRRANRLRQCPTPKAHKDGCDCGHRAAGVAVLGTSITFDAQGTPRNVQLLGRREADRTRVVGWADHGYWLGHRFIGETTVKPASVTPAARRADDAARKRKAAQARRAARLSDLQRTEAIVATATPR